MDSKNTKIFVVVQVRTHLFRVSFNVRPFLTQLFAQCICSTDLCAYLYICVDPLLIIVFPYIFIVISIFVESGSN